MKVDRVGQFKSGNILNPPTLKTTLWFFSSQNLYISTLHDIWPSKIFWCCCFWDDFACRL